MSDLISKQKLLQWLEREMNDESLGYRAGIKWAALQVERGDFDTEPSEVQQKVELWVCPDCAFAFDAVHEDVDGGYSCPHCATIRLSEALNHIHKCAKFELVCLMYESQRKDWEDILLTAEAALSPQSEVVIE